MIKQIARSGLAYVVELAFIVSYKSYSYVRYRVSKMSCEYCILRWLSRSADRALTVTVANPACGQLNRENEFFLS